MKTPAEFEMKYNGTEITVKGAWDHDEVDFYGNIEIIIAGRPRHSFLSEEAYEDIEARARLEYKTWLEEEAKRRSLALEDRHALPA
jgi:hypothetical protein